MWVIPNAICTIPQSSPLITMLIAVMDGLCGYGIVLPTLVPIIVNSWLILTMVPFKFH